MGEDVIQAIRRQRLIAIVRLEDSAALPRAAEALAAAGVQAIEFSLAGASVVEFLRHARQMLPREVALGAGTVLDRSTALACIEAGADFIVSPGFHSEVVITCQAAGVPVIAGAMTPTEIHHAYEHGAALVKVFPAAVLGPRFFRDIRAPLPQIPLVAIGGLSAENAKDYLQAGAVAVGVGNGLVSPRLGVGADWSGLTARARALLELVGGSEPIPE
ncbi:MAG: bifunctional 4-hydroxy-2-oxoglutarate aldolase/2-dehydro-3-deoxy-phosphogluconate aldolase [Anaerolineales bacterium]